MRLLQNNSAIRFVFWAFVFTLTCTLAPLFYSNQNQYFVHGLAHGGFGFLAEDWLANTGDPTPIFSALVSWTFRLAHANAFYLYFMLLLGIYFHSLVGIFTFLAGEKVGGTGRLLFITLLLAVHSGAARWGSVQLFGVDYPWYFQAGVAGQYILGFGLQPSVFGVLLVQSVYLFVRGRPFLAATAAALAGIVHATYLLGAAFFVLAYMLQVWTGPNGSWRRAILLGAWALILVLPVVVYNLVAFAPSSPGAFAEAQRLLAHFRIPHHALPELWFDGIAMSQVGWIALAIWLTRGTTLFPIMLIPFFLSLSLSALQVATGNDTLALLFPWRVSAVLMPLATAVVLTRIVLRLVHRDYFAVPHCLTSPPAPIPEGEGGKHFTRSAHGVDEPEETCPQLSSPTGEGVGGEGNLPLHGVPEASGVNRCIVKTCVAVIALLVVGGVAINYLGLAYRSNEDELPLLQYVREHARRGDVYLLPVDVPKLDAGRKGARSTSFTPPPLRDKDHHLIAIDLQRFRLFTGAAIVVDFKSIPYKDVEVLAWHDRLLTCRKLYRDGDWDEETLSRFGVTHVVATGRQKIRDKRLEKVFGNVDSAYRLYRVVK